MFSILSYSLIGISYSSKSACSLDIRPSFVCMYIIVQTAFPMTAPNAGKGINTFSANEDNSLMQEATIVGNLANAPDV